MVKQMSFCQPSPQHSPQDTLQEPSCMPGTPWTGQRGCSLGAGPGACVSSGRNSLCFELLRLLVESPAFYLRWCPRHEQNGALAGTPSCSCNINDNCREHGLSDSFSSLEVHGEFKAADLALQLSQCCHAALLTGTRGFDNESAYYFSFLLQL